MITDLDKYGLVALTIVVVLILFIAMNDMGDDSDLDLNGVYFTDSDQTENSNSTRNEDAVVVLDNPAIETGSQKGSQGADFDFMEAPAHYPGQPSTTPAQLTQQASQTSVNVHHVEKGDTLSLISNRYYGSTKWWKTIADANPNVNPKNLAIGDRIRIPLLEQDEGTSASANRISENPSQAKISETKVKSETYRVKNGDTLGKIAKVLYGNSGKWETIFAANKNKIRDPKSLQVGVELNIPR
ncbi:MAG: LysM peptidoglycan-binding domain-containing protein [Planctomycetota bacterium]